MLRKPKTIKKKVTIKPKRKVKRKVPNDVRKIGNRGYQVQKATGRHKVACAECQITPELGTERLLITKGAGKWSKSSVYCDKCAAGILDREIHVLRNLQGMFTGSIVF